MAVWWKMPPAPGKESHLMVLPSMNVTRGWSRRCSMFTRPAGDDVVYEEFMVVPLISAF
ncbi:hypothetical protein [Methanoculleus bourgensis]|uniref:hypothetical protein n=1 Tax=Methanoculleus bourgensis TaxID=83986 RepID=UPI0012F6AC60|nr:hypothetical protein [Methanoculleus bourgensis]